MEKVRLGFVGVGGMGQCAHLRNYVCDPECEVVALAELRTDLGRRVAERYGVPRVYRDHREMLAAEMLDGIVAIQPYRAHGPLLPDLLQAGRPILIEKPLARSVEAGERIVAAVQQTGSPLYIGYHKRSDPATVFAKQVISEWTASGALGSLRYVRISMPPGKWEAAGFSHLVGSDEAYPDIPADPAPPGMDVETARRLDAFVNYYIHQVNLLRHLYGEGYSVDYADPSGVLMATQSASGIAGALEMAPYQTTLDWQESALAAFDKGWVRVDLPAPLVVDQPGRVTVFEDAGDRGPRTWSPTLPPVHAMRQQAGYFVKAVRGEPTPLCESDDALADLRVAEAYIALWARSTSA